MLSKTKELKLHLSIKAGDVSTDNMIANLSPGKIMERMNEIMQHQGKATPEVSSESNKGMMRLMQTASPSFNF